MSRFCRATVDIEIDGQPATAVCTKTLDDNGRHPEAHRCQIEWAADEWVEDETT